MADTAHKTEEEIREFHDPPEVFAAKIDQLADMIVKSKHMVTWTGAGVSTSTGIPDYRGPNGKWTLAAQKKKRDPSIKVVNSLNASPSPTHMAIVALLRAGMLKKVISTNTDGLHRRSGVQPQEIAELHGNTNKVRCNKCGKFALADQRVRNAAKVHDHKTGQKCPYGCLGEMEDTIINFGEYLLTEVQEDANANGRKADLLLGLGSSFRVITCDALEDIQTNGGSLVIVNLQMTPYDDYCKLRIFATCDEVMTALMAKLKIPIPDWTLHRYVAFRTPAAGATTPPTSAAVRVQGIDETGSAYAWIKSAELVSLPDGVTDVAKATKVGGGVPSSHCVFQPIVCEAKVKTVPATHILLCPMGHRGEPDVLVPLPKAPVADGTSFHLALDMKTNTWKISSIGVVAMPSAKSAAPKKRSPSKTR